MQIIGATLTADSEAVMAERVMQMRARHLLKQDGSKNRYFACCYCKDKKHILIDYAWIMVDSGFGRIPVGVDMRDYYDFPDLKPHRTMIRCDCYHTESGRSEDKNTRTCKRFRDYFGAHIKDHPYGEQIRAHRARMAADPAGLYQRPERLGPGQMTEDQAWEELEKSIPDPSMPVLELENYLEDLDDLPPF